MVERYYGFQRDESQSRNPLWERLKKLELQQLHIVLFIIVIVLGAILLVASLMPLSGYESFKTPLNSVEPEVTSP